MGNSGRDTTSRCPLPWFGGLAPRAHQLRLPFLLGGQRTHTHTIGDTFEFAFNLPKPANSDNTRPKKRKATNSNRETRAGTTKHKKATKPARAPPH